MTNALKVKGVTHKTEYRRKSDSVKKNKENKGFTSDDCEWTIEKTKPTELPDLFLLEKRG